MRQRGAMIGRSLRSGTTSPTKLTKEIFFFFCPIVSMYLRQASSKTGGVASQVILQTRFGFHGAIRPSYTAGIAQGGKGVLHSVISVEDTSSG